MPNWVNKSPNEVCCVQFSILIDQSNVHYAKNSMCLKLTSKNTPEVISIKKYHQCIRKTRIWSKSIMNLFLIILLLSRPKNIDLTKLFLKSISRTKHTYLYIIQMCFVYKKWQNKNIKYAPHHCLRQNVSLYFSVHLLILWALFVFHKGLIFIYTLPYWLPLFLVKL